MGSGEWGVGGEEPMKKRIGALSCCNLIKLAILLPVADNSFRANYSRGLLWSLLKRVPQM
ncbi:hypothetical protein [Nostoc sp.]